MRINDYEGDPLDDLRCLGHLRARLAVKFDQVERPLAWEEDLDRLDPAAHKLSLLDLGVLVPRHEAVTGELLELATEIVTAVLAHVVLMALEEVIDEIVELWVVSGSPGVLVSKLSRIVLVCEEVRLIDLTNRVQIAFLVGKPIRICFFVGSIDGSGLLRDYRLPVLPVLSVTTENALVERPVILITELESVHLSTSEAVE